MSYSVKVEPSNHSFEVEGDETVLEAALRNGLSFPYGCRNGVCGNCKGRLISGEVEYDPEKMGALSDEDKENNIALFCQGRPKTDLTVEVQLVSSGDEIEVKKMPCRVVQKEFLAHDVVALWLKLPANERLQFLAGQYIDILLKDGRRRSFSIANAPHDDEFIELHIRHIDGGDFTGHVFDSMKTKAILRIEGPHGSFYLREDSNRPMIFMAGGTGFAPTKGIIEHAIAEKLSNPMYLYWGARANRDLYMKDLAESWAAKHDNLTFIPVLSDPMPEDNWQGRTGYVHEAIAADFDDLSGMDIYACGPPAMVHAGKDVFEKLGLELEHYYSDAFEFQDPKKED